MQKPRLTVAHGVATLHLGSLSAPSAWRERDHALRAALEIPGIRGNEHIVLPRSTWQLPQVQALLDVVQIEDHVRARLHPLPPSSVRAGLWNGRESLYPFQVEAVGHALQRGGLLLADEMGLGKTRTAIVAAETVAGDVGGDRARLVLGPRFARAVWRDELLRMGAIVDEHEFCAIDGLSLDDPSWNPEARWYFIHYEIAAAWWSRFNMMGRRRPCAIIIDEVHWAKNPRTRRAKAAACIASTGAGSPLIMGLTGTPLANRPSEIWQPLTLVTGPRTWGYYNDFRIRYCGATATSGGHLTDGDPSYVDEFAQRLEDCYMRRTAADVKLDLPPLVRHRIEVDIDKSTLDAHRDMLSGLDIRELVRAIAQHRAGRDSLDILNKLRKLTSAAKIKSTIAFVHEMVEQDRSVVVFGWERRTVDAIATRLTGYPIHGGYPQEVREHSVAAFQSGGGVLCATFDSLKEGVTLTKADVVVMHDLDWVPSTVLQAEKRVHRIGQRTPVTSAWMVAQGSIDTLIADVLLLKADYIQSMLGIDAPQNLMDDLDLPSIAYDTMADFEQRLDRWRRSA